MNDHFLDRISFRDTYLATRSVKAAKILRILREHRTDLGDAFLLDIGCSRGHVTQRLAEEFAFVVGLDYDLEEQPKHRNFHFVQADGCRLPLSGEMFDVVVINHIIEHVASPEHLLAEVWRVLKPGGIVYLACPNRLSVVEPHYRLPLLSWLPRNWADRYVRAAGRGDRYRDNLPSYWRLKRLTQRFLVSNETLLVLKQPARFLQGDEEYNWVLRLVARFPSWLLRALLPVIPVWILVLKKEETLRSQSSLSVRKAEAV